MTKEGKAGAGGVGVEYGKGTSESSHKGFACSSRVSLVPLMDSLTYVLAVPPEPSVTTAERRRKHHMFSCHSSSCIAPAMVTSRVVRLGGLGPRGGDRSKVAISLKAKAPPEPKPGEGQAVGCHDAGRPARPE